MKGFRALSNGIGSITPSDRAAPGGDTVALFTPKLISALKEGYGRERLRADLTAGLTVAVVALPLSMALAIASGTTPDKGLLTAVVAGFLISALGGSRFQIGGPTGAFVVVVFGVVQKFGYDGLILATLMAGAMLLLAGLLRLGTYIKYIPQPVVTGFTAGIAVIIFTSQLGEIFGIDLSGGSGEVADRVLLLIERIGLTDPKTLAVSLGALAVILGLRRWRPAWPGFLIAVVAASVIVWLTGLPVETIASRFGGVPAIPEIPAFPEVTLARLQELLPSAFTIAFLAGVESLLCAVVADGMTGRRHRSNCELVAQGVANLASAAVGGLPATGAIARTATNIRAGALTPVAGIAHAVFLLVVMLVAAPLLDRVPLAALAAILLVVAWNMSEIDRIKVLMRAPMGDRLTLIITFALTVLVDLTVAIEVGVVLAAFLFMHRMAGAVEIETGADLMKRDVPDMPEGEGMEGLPPGIGAFQINGPFFFGVAGRLGEVLDRIGPPPKVFILRLGGVPLIDATGAHALEGMVDRLRRHGTIVILSHLGEKPRAVVDRMGLIDGNHVRTAPDFAEALKMAKGLLIAQGR